MGKHETALYRVYFVEGSGEDFGTNLAALLAAIEERDEDIEHLTTYAARDDDGRWQQAAHVVGRVALASTCPARRPPQIW
jgi:hypothetical protein